MKDKIDLLMEFLDVTHLDGTGTREDATDRIMVRRRIQNELIRVHGYTQFEIELFRLAARRMGNDDLVKKMGDAMANRTGELQDS